MNTEKKLTTDKTGGSIFTNLLTPNKLSEISFEESASDLPPAYQTRPFSLFVKQVFDFVFAAATLAVLSPLLVVVAVAVKLNDSGPVFFKQIRAGRFNKPFTLYKFRTMQVGSEKGSLEIVKNDPRITRLGRFLRNSSIDELPQLFNILRGEMSLIGPRPLLPGTVHDYEMRRQEMKPGMTSLPVLYGRQKLDWETRMLIDIWSVTHWSLSLDLYILIKTPFIVLLQKDIGDARGGSYSRATFADAAAQNGIDD